MIIISNYSPPIRFDTPIELLIPTVTTHLGVNSKTFPDKGPIIMCSFRTFGGTETSINGVYSIENTATVETWYNPSITAECRVRLDGANYEIMGEPEDINRRHQFMKFKVRRIGGGA